MPLFRRIFPFLLLSVLLLSACSGVKPDSTRAPEKFGPGAQSRGRALKDLERFPQQIAAFAIRAGNDAPLISARRQAEEAEQFKNMFFRPWTMKKSGLSAKNFAASATGYEKTVFYGRNLLPIPEAERKSLTARTGTAAFPSLAEHGIVTRETSMRVLPSSTPFYHAPWKAGEGYPFDMLQHGVMRRGTPLFVSHASTDGTWLFCETVWGAGWLPADAVAITDSAFEETWKALPLAVIIKENAPLFATDGIPTAQADTRGNAPLSFRSAANLHVGTLLPYRTRDGNKAALLLPGRDEHGKARITEYVTADGNATPFPLPFTAANMAMLADQLMGAPYEWGGAYGGRDCSLLTRELFQAVGVFLPVNSARQLASGSPHRLDSMDPDEKLRFIRDNAIPFRTLIGFPGHVALYIGEWDNEPAMLHCIWGLRTKEENVNGRLLIGKVVVTSLNPGVEWEDVRAGAPLLPRFKTMTVLPPDPDAESRD